MPQFHYVAINQEGKQYDAHLQAVDRFAVYDAVRKEGGSIVSVEETGRTAKKLRGFNPFGGVTLEEKILFSRNVATMIKAGLPLSRALSVSERQTHNASFRRVLQDVNARITKGASFHEALEQFPKIFPPFYTAMVKAGEEGGSLADSLHVTERQMERTYTLGKKVRGALIYPAIILFVMLVIGVLMLTYIVPTLAQTFEEMGADLPWSTQFIIDMSNFLVAHSLIAAGAFLVIVVGIGTGLRTRIGKRVGEYCLLHVPIISGIVKETNSARTARTLSSLLIAGVEVVRALSITREVVQNSFYQDVLEQAQDSVQRGSPISKSFLEHERLYPALMGEIAAVGEETGKLSDMLGEIAEFYESEVEQKTKDMSTVIEPFLMLFIGAAVGFFALSMISPIYSLSSGI
jgi:type IV pilus assembly protein PilC